MNEPSRKMEGETRHYYQNSAVIVTSESIETFFQPRKRRRKNDATVTPLASVINKTLFIAGSLPDHLIV